MNRSIISSVDDTVGYMASSSPIWYSRCSGSLLISDSQYLGSSRMARAGRVRASYSHQTGPDMGKYCKRRLSLVVVGRRNYQLKFYLFSAEKMFEYAFEEPKLWASNSPSVQLVQHRPDQRGCHGLLRAKFTFPKLSPFEPNMQC